MNHHDFNWASTHLKFYMEKHTLKREIAEMFYIKKHNNNINLQKDTDNLSNIYNRIINSTWVTSFVFHLCRILNILLLVCRVPYHNVPYHADV